MTTAATTVEIPPADERFDFVGGNVQHGRKLRDFVKLVKRRTEETGVRTGLLSVQELQEGRDEEVAERLGLTLVRAQANPRPGSRNALYFDPALFRINSDWKPYPARIRHVPAVAKLHMIHPETGEPSFRDMAVASVHASYFDPNLREQQVRWLSEVVKDEDLGLFQGDWNSWPVGRAPLTLDNILDRAHAQQRSILMPDGSLCPDDVADRLLTYHGMPDVGAYAATVLGQVGADRPTTGHGADKGRQRVPATDRPAAGIGAIDRTHASRELLSALVSAETLDTPQTRAISDHLPQVTSWSVRRLWDVMDLPITPVRH
ncbi:hypothetical protein [Kitasatospora griseola]